MLPILARESLSAASSDCSLFSSKDNSALRLSAWMDNENHIKVKTNITTHNIKSAKFKKHISALFTYPSECFRELGSLSLQQLPLNLPLLVSLPHCRQLSTLGWGSTLTLLPLLLSVPKQHTRNVITVYVRATKKCVKLMRLMSFGGVLWHCLSPQMHVHTRKHCGFLIRLLVVYMVNFPGYGFCLLPWDASKNYSKKSDFISDFEAGSVGLSVMWKKKLGV